MKKEVKKITVQILSEFISKELVRRSNNVKDHDDLLYIEPSGAQYELIYGIFLNNQMVGYISVEKNNPQHCDKLYISDLYRRHGLASFSLNYLNINSVWTLQDNKTSIEFYQSLGFKVTGKSYSMLIMTRETTQFTKPNGEITMKTYSERFSEIHHKYSKKKIQRHSISTESFFDLFKSKKKEDDSEKTIEDFVKLFNQQFEVLEKEIKESDKLEWVISSTLLGQVKSGSDLIKSVKGQISFLKELEKAQDRVVSGLQACNSFTKKISVDYENKKLIIDSYNKLFDYRITYKHFPSLTTYNKQNGAIFLTDKFDTFFIRMNYSETSYTSSHYEDKDVDEMLNSYCNVPGIHADFKFSKDYATTLNLTKEEYISLIEQLKSINSKLLVLYKKYLDTTASNLYSEIKDANSIYKKIVENQNINELKSLLNGADGIINNYIEGIYTGFCQSVADAYVKYIHSFLNKQTNN